MDRRTLFGDQTVSVLTLGGGGLGQLWGPTSQDEAVATVRRAVELGIDLIDVAPLYGNGEAERVIGLAFDGGVPPGVRIETKCGLGSPPAGEVYERLSQSLNDSLDRMRLRRVDLFILHGNISMDAPEGATTRTDRVLFKTAVIDAFTRLVDEGRVGAWGISGIGEPDALIETLGSSPKPAVVQCITNALHSAGGLKRFEGSLRADEVRATAVKNGVGVLGIRAVQAGALVDQPDRELRGADADDFARAAPFRRLAADWGASAAALAHRYALSIDGVASVVLGVKNRDELEECVAAAEAGPLTSEQMQEIDSALR